MAAGHIVAHAKAVLAQQLALAPDMVNQDEQGLLQFLANAEQAATKLLNKLSVKSQELEKAESASVPPDQFLRLPQFAAKYSAASFDASGKPSADAAGELVRRWDASGPEGAWRVIHGLFVDHDGFVWTNARESNLTLKFTPEGEHVLTIGRLDETGASNDPELMGRPAEIWVDPADNEVFVRDPPSAVWF